MNRIRVAAIVALCAGGQALGQSTMTFGLQLGGNPQVDQWEALNDAAQYIPGSPANDQTFASGSVVNWAATVATGGIHQTTPDGGLGDNLAPNGVANLVFTLELHQGTAGGPLVQVGRLSAGTPNIPTGVGFYSTFNDGDADGRGDFGLDPDPLENAAFTRSFDAVINASAGPGRIWDSLGDSGPRLDRAQYPSASGKAGGRISGGSYNAAVGSTTAALGKLVGMGAGYSQYTRIGDIRTPGVGGGGGACSLPVVPVAEGQIKLADGCYTLVLVPGTGNNILRGGFNCATEAPGSFAVAVNTPPASVSLSFKVGAGSCEGPQPALVSAASRRTHGATDRDLAAPLTGAVVEPRVGTVKVLMNFSAAPGALTCGSFTVTGGTCGSVAVSGNSAVVTMSAVTANGCLKVAATGVAGLIGDNDVAISIHQGNVNQDASVNVADLSLIKNVLLVPVTDLNSALRDVNVDNSINLADLLATKNNLLIARAACP